MFVALKAYREEHSFIADKAKMKEPLTYSLCMCQFIHLFYIFISCAFYCQTVGLLGFPGGSAGKESTYNAGDLGTIPGLGRSPGGGHGNSL